MQNTFTFINSDLFPLLTRNVVTLKWECSNSKYWNSEEPGEEMLT